MTLGIESNPISLATTLGAALSSQAAAIELTDSVMWSVGWVGRLREQSIRRKIPARRLTVVLVEEDEADDDDDGDDDIDELRDSNNFLDSVEFKRLEVSGHAGFLYQNKKRMMIWNRCK